MSTTQHRTFPYAIVDVFGERPLEGNPLAIFTDARGLATDEMQALARETNLAETTFILPSDDPAEDAREGVRVRIFTVQEELPFAGHPTLGTAAWLHANHPALRGAESVTLRLGVGPITVRFDPTEQCGPGVLTGAFGTMRQNAPVFGQIHDPQAITHATGIPADELDTTLPIQTVTTGLAFCIVPVRSLEALAQLAIPRAQSEAYLRQSDAKFFYVFTRAPKDSAAQFRARMQFYNGEDPATGSASGCVISYLVMNGLIAPGSETILEQGVEIFRYSKIHASATLTPVGEEAVCVGGRTVFVAKGEFSLP
jgi:trans-2,3-dihydro-3-hydroxyanthranilate isomerase